MKIIKIDRSQQVPEVEVLISGPRSKQRVTLIFDTGAGCTQIDTGLIEDIGYSAKNAKERMNVIGATGAAQEGYLIEIAQITFFGKRILNPTVGVYDFDNFPGVDGLLGWDIISGLNIEMNGLEGTIKVS